MRLFLAIDFPDELKVRIARNIEILKGYIPKGIKWVDKKNLHVTFKFLGDVNERILEDLYATIEGITGKHSPFTISFKDAEIIPNPERPRLIWYDMRDDTESASKLFKGVDLALYDMGFSKEKRPLALHTTLGRVKFARKIEWGKISSNLMSLDDIVQCRELTLFKSRLTPSGPIYSILKTFLLKKTDKDGGNI
ncbi:MAG: RNA 2',3'-cyclic phosphodiesterase [Candidatus Celaenobacter polaris]|nr:RNA 2',3'-cyclic phosphodiesterase [Candidatus Celaenobacter polaris]